MVAFAFIPSSWEAEGVHFYKFQHKSCLKKVTFLKIYLSNNNNSMLLRFEIRLYADLHAFYMLFYLVMWNQLVSELTAFSCMNEGLILHSLGTLHFI